MTEKTEDLRANRFCTVCGTPAGNGKRCEHCATVLDVPEDAGLVEDEGAPVRRDFEGRGEQREPMA
ncbi:hypothetical protein ACIOHS_35845 [Streptomyces sp. NPDC088253]|uniref:hypothetical protein n=1 Tax=Streptomyces sp. NPDC088253 TaxID=3365846 RepID=UPI00381F0FB3